MGKFNYIYYISKECNVHVSIQTSFIDTIPSSLCLLFVVIIYFYHVIYVNISVHLSYSKLKRNKIYIFLRQTRLIYHNFL